MASQKYIEAKKVEELAEMNRKLDLIMAKLGITDEAKAPATQAAPAEGESETSEAAPRKKK